MTNNICSCTVICLLCFLLDVGDGSFYGHAHADRHGGHHSSYSVSEFAVYVIHVLVIIIMQSHRNIFIYEGGRGVLASILCGRGNVISVYFLRRFREH